MSTRLETSRLIVRTLERRDAEPYLAMVTDPEVIRYLPPAPPATMATAQAAVESRHAMEAELGYAMWAVEDKTTGAFVGQHTRGAPGIPGRTSEAPRGMRARLTGTGKPPGTPSGCARLAAVERYVIRGGREGYNRLLLLARASWPDTAALFGRAGIRPGMQCVDLGCGGGEVTFELAKLVEPGGFVTGVDMDEVKLGLARKAAVERGVGNVEFLAGNVTNWDDPGAFDVVYSRFLLQHLSEPVNLLHRMWAAVRPGGLVIVEDADFDGWCCHPPNEGFDFFVRAYAEVIRRRGGDHATGRKLYHYFLDAGIPAPQVALVQAVFVSGEGKELAWSTLDATSEAILAEGVATSGELAGALASLRQFTDDETTLIARPRVFQLWSARAPT